jgi:hypothetical protein
MAQDEVGRSDEQICHDCGVLEGQIHELGCDMERCAFCAGQFIGCDCRYETLNIDHRPGTYAYQNGLTDEQKAGWMAILNKKGRVPFIEYPNMCARCGKHWPEMFMVSDKEWEHYIETSHRNDILCLDCYLHIREIIDKRSGKRQEHTALRRIV